MKSIRQPAAARLRQLGAVLLLALGCDDEPKAAPACDSTAGCDVQGCAPGSVASCSGPAGCDGGQVCRADGSGYEPCDCSAGASLLVPTNCIEAGDFNCSLSNRCCPGSTCITYGDVVVCAALCTSGEDCESGCCTPREPTISVCSPPDECRPAQMCLVAADCETQCCKAFECAPRSSCASQQTPLASGFSLYAEDGAYLGVLSSDTSTLEGVCNPFSRFGSRTSPTSIFNPIGAYGSVASPLSAYNPATFTPPFFYDAVNDEYWAVVSKNTALSLVIDPDALCATLPSLGL